VRGREREREREEEEERDKYVGISHVVWYHLSNTRKARYVFNMNISPVGCWWHSVLIHE